MPRGIDQRHRPRRPRLQTHYSFVPMRLGRRGVLSRTSPPSLHQGERLQHGSPRGTIPAALGGYTVKPGRAGSPYFNGFSRSCFKVAEREGLPNQQDRTNKIKDLLRAQVGRVYQSCAPKSTRFRDTVQQKHTPIAYRELMRSLDTSLKRFLVFVCPTSCPHSFTSGA